MRATSWLLIALLAEGAPARAQLTEGQVPYIETLEVRIHNLDVIVTDPRGKAVRSLTKEDFELFEDGVRKEITNFSAFGAAGPARGADGAPAATEDAAPQPKHAVRRFVFYIDDMSLPAPTQRSLRKELDELLQETLRSGDEAAVIEAASPATGTLAFTDDRAAVGKRLAEAIDRQRWRATSTPAMEMRLLEIELRNAGRNEHERRLALRRYARAVQRRVQQRLGRLNAAVNAVGLLSGRKVLVLVTESLPAEPGREAFARLFEEPAVGIAQEEGTTFGEWTAAPADAIDVDWVNLKPLVEEIARTAATNGITIYAIQPEYGLADVTPSIGVDSRSTRAQGSAAVAPRGGGGLYFTEKSSNTEASIRTLAEITGGTWTRGGRVARAADEIARDVSSYYSIGYRAGEGHDQPRRIEVRVKGRPELRVRTRREVIRKSPTREMTDRVVAALVAPPHLEEIALRIETGPAAASLDRAYRTIDVHTLIPLSAMTFLPHGEGYRATFTVHYAVTGSASDFVSGSHGPHAIDVPAAQLEAARGTYYRYTIPMQVRTGKHRVAIGVLDAVSHLSGIERVDVEVK